MTHRERIEAAFENRETDKVPICHISASSDVASRLLGRETYVGFGIQQWREAAALWEGEDAHAEFLIHIPREEAWLEAVALRPDLVARQLDIQVESTRRTVPKRVDSGRCAVGRRGGAALRTGREREDVLHNGNSRVESLDGPGILHEDVFHLSFSPGLKQF